MSKILPPFKFKKFSITHEKCAMKVGVDGVLIGAWTNIKNPKNILDIGTGSGLISLMLQQKYPNASIVAIEPNVLAFKEAQENFRSYQSTNKPKIILTKLKDFKASTLFDLIISNPPFFEELVPSGDLNRDQARQAVFLPLEEFIEGSANMLSKNGCFNFIYPTHQTEKILKFAKEANLYLAKTTVVFPNKQKSSKRTLFSFTKSDQIIYPEKLIIKNSNGSFTQEYQDLTKDFYINF